MDKVVQVIQRLDADPSQYLRFSWTSDDEIDFLAFGSTADEDLEMVLERDGHKGKAVPGYTVEVSVGRV